MADTSKTVAEQQAGSSKLELPTHKRGSSVTVKPKSPSPDKNSSPEEQIALTDQPTAISRQPPIDARRSSTTTRLMAKSLVGKKLLHFEVEDFVGGGGMGAVFRGTDTTLRRTVAIKVLSQDHLDDEMIRRFQHEAESAARLHHDAIPHVYYVGEDGGWYFIVFEFIEGKNIRDYVADQGPLSIPQAINHLADIAEAIRHASSREVVHRDIKPSNVLVTNEGRAHLVDMGLARTEQLQSTANELTATGVTLGTFDYISPEQAKDPRNVDTRSDIYSLGCTLYFMLTGQPPFPDGTMLQKLLNHSSEAPPDPRQFRSDIPPRMTELLARMLAKDPEHRQQTAEELLGDIFVLAEEQNVPLYNATQMKIVVERPVIQEAAGWSRHIPWMVPLLVLVATAIGLHLWKVDPSVPADLSTLGSSTTQSTSQEPNSELENELIPLIDESDQLSPVIGNESPERPERLRSRDVRSDDFRSDSFGPPREELDGDAAFDDMGFR